MTSKLLNPNLDPILPFANKGKRVVHRTTFSPSTAVGGDTLRIEIPLFGAGVVLEPKSFKLRFELEVGTGVGTNHLVFNVSRNLVENFSVMIGKYTISEIKRYDLYKGYHDLLQIEEDMKMGITNEDIRKIRAKATGASTNTAMVIHSAAYGRTYEIPLNHEIIDKFGCFYNRALHDKIEFNLLIANEGDIVITSDNTKNHSFKLKNIQLEYATIRNEELINSVSSNYNEGKSIYMEDIHLFKRMGPMNFATHKNVSVAINRNVKAMKGVLFLFTKVYAAGARDTEEFVNPKITSVEITIDGEPNSLYSRGIQSDDVWKDMLKKVEKVHKNFGERDFQNHKYGLWVDLRMSQDNTLHGDGRILGVNGDLRIDITSISTETALNCHIFTVSDSGLYIQKGKVDNYNF